MGETFPTQPPRKPGHAEGEGKGTELPFFTDLTPHNLQVRVDSKVALPGPEPGVVRSSSASCA